MLCFTGERFFLTRNTVKKMLKHTIFVLSILLFLISNLLLALNDNLMAQNASKMTKTRIL